MENEILKKVQETLSGALGVDAADVIPEASLTRDLGAESIDFIDIIFRLEKTFDIKIPSGELFPGNLLNDERFVQNGVVTPEGIAELRAKVPYMDVKAFAQNPQITRLAEHFTVQMILNYVQDRVSRDAKI